MLSDRASRYLATWQRVPQIATEAEVRDALCRAGVPVAQPFLDFHRTFAGYVFDCVLEVGVLGLVFPDPAWGDPYQLGAWKPEPPEYPLWRVQIADVHPSFSWVIDEEGTYFIAADVRVASSFGRYVEQLAFWAEFTKQHRCWTGDLATNNPADLLSRKLLPRLQPNLVPELSDSFSQVYATADLAVWIVRDRDYIDVAVRAGAEPPELAGLVWGGSSRQVAPEISPDDVNPS